MIVQMKKVSLLVLDSERESALKALRKLGLVHIEITQGSGERLTRLKDESAQLENAIGLLSDRAKKNGGHDNVTVDEALSTAKLVDELADEQKNLQGELAALKTELDRTREWGDIDPDELAELAKKGIDLLLCELSPTEYDKLDENVTTLLLSRNKNSVRFAALKKPDSELPAVIRASRVELPKLATSELRRKIEETEAKIESISATLTEKAKQIESMKSAIASIHKQIEFETYASGMSSESLGDVAIAYFTGYIPADELDKLTAVASENSWGLLAEDPTEEDDAPTELRNNKFVSLIYPLTDFIGTVPGYFEYDISAWFLGFILVFFGIIFGDGGYGLLICVAAGALLLKDKLAGKKVSPTWLLILLLGGATVIWGVLTCTWFGLPADTLPVWMQKISIPVISNVNESRLWQPPWVSGDVGLTTAQNVQIFCFALALIQLSVAHIKGAVRHRGSLKMLGDIGSVLQLIGMFYVVLSLVVNSEVFGFGLVISGIPIGTIAIACIAVGFVMSFIFANYEGSIGKSVLESLKGIVSVLLGVVNVFSDIVSYIRLWAVGLAGAAISQTVNDLASPFLGSALTIVFAIILLVFGHGLNMILNVLSVIVHGVRLNTLEFSTHLDMSWSGHKYKPFEE